MKTLIAKLMVTALCAMAFVSWAEDGHGKKEDKTKLKPQATCPVMKGKINKALFVDHEGQRIYVCCKGCIAPIKKDPEKYIKKLAAKGEYPMKLQTVCPVMGGKINKAMFVDHEGQRIYVCCKGCIAPIKKDPAKYIAKLAEKGQIPHDVPSKKKVMEKKKHKGSHH